MEDRELGIAKLKELSRLDGDPGMWAAVALASRGNEQAVDRAFELLDSPGDPETSDFLHGDLRSRLWVLLSNSAGSSGVPLPRTDTDMRAWWKEHGRKVRIHDPWLEILDKQKVD